MTRTYRIDHIALLVRDLERSVAFYRDVMGFEPIERQGSPNVTWLRIGGIQAIHLIEGDFGSTRVTKNTHFAISTDDIHAFAADLDARDVSYCDWGGKSGRIGLHRDGFHQLYVQDPDGYWVEINDHGKIVSA